MHKIHLIDLEFQNTKQAIGCFLIPTSTGVVLVECGPESTFSQLEMGLAGLGYSLSDVKHVLLTHIHFDHAGAAWKLANEGAKIYVHPLGLPHLASPEKLWNSAAQIYGDSMERLWGEMQPVAKDLLVSAEHEETFDLDRLHAKAWHTPGHAIHHIAWQVGEVLFTGDVAGVKIAEGPVVPPCPPPDINLKDWRRSLDLIRKISPTRLMLTHFGEILTVSEHLNELEAVLDDWSSWIKPRFDSGLAPEEIIPLFTDYTTQQLISMGVSRETITRYEYANPSWMSVSGLMRYWKLRVQGRI
jgi:glyoxylase-like metal-dependent hydrolase (beta-lactamase superfamily II)